MRILFISSQMLFSGSRFGGAKRLFYLARELERLGALNLVCMDGCREWDPSLPPPEEFTRQLSLPMPSHLAPWNRLSLFGDSAQVFRRNRSAIEELVGFGKYDATFLAYPLALRFMDMDWQAELGRIIYLEDDLIIEQFRKNCRSGSIGGKLAAWLRYRQARSFFASRFKRVKAFTCISQEEQKVVNSYFPGLATHVLGYGIPLEEYPLLPPVTSRTVLGFIGNYRHAPNLDALQWLLDDLFPYVKAQLPEVTLVLAGNGFPREVAERLKGDASIRIIGNVEDLREFYGSIGIFVNPIRSGRGMRTKLVEAAAFGRPILSTPLGAESLGELDLGIWSNRQGLLDCLRKLLENADQNEIVLRNRRVAESKFSSQTVAGQLARILTGRE